MKKFAFLLIFFTFLACFGWGAEYTWNGGDDDDWNNYLNWNFEDSGAPDDSGGSYPGLSAGDTVIININASIRLTDDIEDLRDFIFESDVTLRLGFYGLTAESITVNGNVTITDGSLNVTNSIKVYPDRLLDLCGAADIKAGSITNDGMIDIGSAPFQTTGGFDNNLFFKLHGAPDQVTVNLPPDSPVPGIIWYYGNTGGNWVFGENYDILCIDSLADMEPADDLNIYQAAYFQSGISADSVTVLGIADISDNVTIQTSGEQNYASLKLSGSNSQIIASNVVIGGGLISETQSDLMLNVSGAITINGDIGENGSALGDLVILNGTMDLGANSIFAASVENSGLIILDGSQTISSGAINGTGLIEFDGNGTGLAGLAQFYNLKISGGNRAAHSNLSVTNSLTIGNSAALSMGTRNLSIKNLTIESGGTLNAGTGTLNSITVTDGVWDNSGVFNHNNGTVIFNNSTVNDSNTFNFAECYNDVTFNGGNTFARLDARSGSIIMFANSLTQNITALNADGATLQAVVSGNEGSRWNLEGRIYPTGLPVIKDCNSTTINHGFIHNLNAKNGGNNNDWVFNENIFIWDGSESGVWSDNDNWLSGTAPFKNNNEAEIIIPIPSQYDNRPALDDDIIIFNLTIGTGAVIDLGGNKLEITEAGGLTNNGTIMLRGIPDQVEIDGSAPMTQEAGAIHYYGFVSGGNQWAFGSSYTNIVIDDTAAMDKAGALEVSGNASFNSGFSAVSVVTGAVIINEDITIAADTDIILNGAVIVNGDVSLTAGNDITLAGAVTGTGSLSIDSSGDIVINGTVGANGSPFDNITILDGNAVFNNLVFAGVIANNGTLSLGSNNISITNLNNTGTLNANAASRLILTGGVWNDSGVFHHNNGIVELNGTVTVNDNNNFYTVNAGAGANVTFTGSNSITLLNAASGADMSFNDDNTINTFNAVNSNVIFADGSAQTINAFNANNTFMRAESTGTSRWKLFGIINPSNSTTIADCDCDDYLNLIAGTNAVDGNNNLRVFKGGTFTWTGNNNNSWENDLNWDKGYYPNPQDNSALIIIPAFTPYNLELDIDVTASSFTINASANVDLAADIEINIINSLINNGTITLDGSQTISAAAFSGTGLYHFNAAGTELAGVFEFANLQISAGNRQARGNLLVTGTLTIDNGAALIMNVHNLSIKDLNINTGGTLSAGTNYSNTITVTDGVWNDSGIFAHNSSILTLNGTVIINGTNTFNVVNIGTGANVTFTGSNIIAALNIAAGAGVTFEDGNSINELNAVNSIIKFANDSTQVIPALYANNTTLQAIITGVDGSRWLLNGEIKFTVNMPTVKDCDSIIIDHEFIDHIHAYNGGNNVNVFIENVYIWTGNDDHDWSNEENWAGKEVPENADDTLIVIKAAPFYPILNTDFECEGLLIETGAAVIDLAGYSLKVAIQKDFINNGTIMLYGAAGQQIIIDDYIPGTPAPGTIHYHGYVAGGNQWVFNDIYTNLIVASDAEMDAADDLKILNYAEFNSNITAESVEVTGFADIKANITTTGNQNYKDDVTVSGSNITLTAVSGNIIFNNGIEINANANLAFSGTVHADGIELSASGNNNITFNNSLVIAGSNVFGSANGDITFNDVSGGGSLELSTGSANIIFNGNYTSTGELAFGTVGANIVFNENYNSSGEITFGAVGGSINLNDVSINMSGAGRIFDTNGNEIELLGAINSITASEVALNSVFGNSKSLTVTANTGNITLNNNVIYIDTLSLNAGNIVLHGDIDNTETLNVNGFLTLGGTGAVRNIGAQEINLSAVTGANNSLILTADDKTVLNGDISGVNILTVNGLLELGGASIERIISAQTVNLGEIKTDSDGDTIAEKSLTINAPNIVFRENISDVVTLTANGTLKFSGTPLSEFILSPQTLNLYNVDGENNYSLTINAENTVLNGDINNVIEFNVYSELTLGGTDATRNINTQGDIRLQTVIGGNNSLVTTSNTMTLFIGDYMNGLNTLTVHGEFAICSSGSEINAQTVNLDIINGDMQYSPKINAANINLYDHIYDVGELTINGLLTLHKTNTIMGGNIINLGAINGNGSSLTINMSDTKLNGVINNVSDLLINNSTEINANISTTGDQIYNGYVTLNSLRTLNAGGSFTTGMGQITAENGININANGAITIGAGGIDQLSAATGSITLNSKSDVYINGNITGRQLIIITDSDVNIGAVTLQTTHSGSEGTAAAIYIKADSFNPDPSSNIIPGQNITAPYGQLCLVLNNDWTANHSIVDGHEEPDPNARWHKHTPIAVSGMHLVYYSGVSKPSIFDENNIEMIEGVDVIYENAANGSRVFKVDAGFNIYIVNIDPALNDLSFTTDSAGSGYIEFRESFLSDNNLDLETGSGGLRLYNAEVEVSGDFDTNGAALTLTGSENVLKARNIVLDSGVILTLDSSDNTLIAQNITLDGGIAGTSDQADNLYLEASNDIRITGTAGSNTAPAVYLGDIKVSGDITFSSSSSVYARSYEQRSGDAVFNSTVNLSDTFEQTGSGTSEFYADVTAGAGISFDGAVTLNNNITFDTDSSLSFASPVNIKGNITLNADNGILLGDSTVLNGDLILITADNNITFNDTITGSYNIDISAGAGNVLFKEQIGFDNGIDTDDYTGNIIINNSGTVVFEDSIFSADINIDSASNVIFEKNVFTKDIGINGVNSVIFEESVSAADISIDGAVSVSFNNSVTAEDITINNADNIIFVEDVSVANINIDNADSVTFEESVTTTANINIDNANSITFENPVTTMADINIDGAVSVAFNNSIIAEDITINNADNIIFVEDVSVANININNASGVTFEKSVTTTANINFNNASSVTFENTVTTTADINIDGAASVSFNNSVTADDIKINSADNIIFTEDVSAANINIDNADSVTFEKSVTTTASININNADSVIFENTVTTAEDINIENAGDITFVESVSAENIDIGNCANVIFAQDVDAGSVIIDDNTPVLIKGDVTTTGTQTYTGEVTLGEDGIVSLHTLSGAVNIGSVLGKGNSLTIDGQAAFSGNVSDVETLIVTGNAAIGANINTNNNQTYGGNVALNGSVVHELITDNGIVAITGSVTGSAGITIKSKGLIAIAQGGINVSGPVIVDSDEGIVVTGDIIAAGASGAVTLETKDEIEVSANINASGKVKIHTTDKVSLNNITINGNISALNLILEANTHTGSIITINSSNINVSSTPLINAIDGVHCPQNNTDPIVVFIRSNTINTSGLGVITISGTSGCVCVYGHNTLGSDKISGGAFENLCDHSGPFEHLIFSSMDPGFGDGYRWLDSKTIFTEDDLIVPLDKDIYIFDVGNNMWAGVDFDLIFETTGEGKIEIRGVFEADVDLVLITDTNIKIADNASIKSPNILFNAQIIGNNKKLAVHGDSIFNGDVSDLTEFTLEGDTQFNGDVSDVNIFTVNGDTTFNSVVTDITEFTLEGNTQFIGSVSDVIVLKINGDTIFHEAVNNVGKLISAGDTEFNKTVNNIEELKLNGEIVFNESVSNIGELKLNGEIVFNETVSNIGELALIGEIEFKGAVNIVEELTLSGEGKFNGAVSDIIKMTLDGMSVFNETVSIVTEFKSDGNAQFIKTVSFVDKLTLLGETVFSDIVNNVKDFASDGDIVFNGAVSEITKLTLKGEMVFNSSLNDVTKFTLDGNIQFNDTVSNVAELIIAGNSVIGGDVASLDLSDVHVNENITVNVNINVNQKDAKNLILDEGSVLDLSAADVSWRIGSGAELSDSFTGYSGALTMNNNSNLIVKNIYLTGSSDVNRFTVNKIGGEWTNISVLGDVKIDENAAFTGDYPRIILKMNKIGTQEITAKIALGSLHIESGSQTVLKNNLEVHGEIVIDYPGVLDAVNGVENYEVTLKAGLNEEKYGDDSAKVGRWIIKNSPNETDPSKAEMKAFKQNADGIVKFEKIAPSGAAFFEIIGNTVWQDFICHDQSGVTIQFSTDPHQHIFLGKFSIKMETGADEADRITLTRYTGNLVAETEEWDYIYITGTVPPNKGLPTTPDPEESDKFWNFNLINEDKIELKYVRLFFSHALYQSITIDPRDPDDHQKIIIEAFPFYKAGVKGYFNYNWREEKELKIIYSFIEDANGNGIADRIRVQTSVTINQNANFSGFNVSVNGYLVEGYKLVPANADSFYIELKEEDHYSLYDGKPITWQVTANTSLKDIRDRLIVSKEDKILEFTAISTIPPRISYALTLPGHNQTYIQMSQPVASYNGAGTINGKDESLSVEDDENRPINNLIYKGIENYITYSLLEPDVKGAVSYLVNNNETYSASDLASLPAIGLDDNPGGASFTMQGLWSLSARALDWSDHKIDTNSSYPRPKYPVDWNYSGYLSYKGNGHVSELDNDPVTGNPDRETEIFVPPFRVLTPVMMRKLENGEKVTPADFANNGELKRRSTDILVSLPPKASDSDNYFAWPVWARIAKTLNQDSANSAGDFWGYTSNDTGIIWEFDGSKSLEARGEIELQARINSALSSKISDLELLWVQAANVQDDFRNPKTLPSKGVSGGLWLPDLLKKPADSDSLYHFVPMYKGDVGRPKSEKNAPLFNYIISPGASFVSGDKIEFIFRIAGNASSPSDMFAARLDIPRASDIPANWYRLVRPFNFDIQDIRQQRGGVTILNNVINPVTGELTYVRYVLTRPGRVTIQVYTLDGSLVKSIRRNEQRDTGEYTESWDGTNNSGRHLARGVYFIRVVGPDIDEIRKVMVVR